MGAKWAGLTASSGGHSQGSQQRHIDCAKYVTLKAVVRNYDLLVLHDLFSVLLIATSLATMYWAVWHGRRM
jgi:hypothetical protein